MSTRVFFITESDDDNEELHETLEQARNYINSQAMSDNTTAVIWIGTCTTAYIEELPDGRQGWNYEDTAQAFNKIKQVN